ncbi:MAG: hypothetical protein R6U98_28130 [Pirellulaceae bacterium]
MTRRIKNLREIRNETAPLLMAELTLLRDDVAAELDEKQSVQWLRWFDRIEEQLASFMKAGNQAGCTSESQ